MDIKQKTTLSCGMLCLFFGAAWLLYTMDILPYAVFDYVFSWPFLLLILGVFFLARNIHNFIGVFFMLGGIISSVDYFWILPKGWGIYLPPLILIFVGIILVVKRGESRLNPARGNYNLLNSSTIFGCNYNKLRSDFFKGGYVSSIFGSNTVDLYRVKLLDGEANIHCTSFLGNTTLVVPRDWDVEFKMITVFGSRKDARFEDCAEIEKTCRLIITGVVFFGGVSIQRRRRVYNSSCSPQKYTKGEPRYPSFYRPYA